MTIAVSGQLAAKNRSWSQAAQHWLLGACVVWAVPFVTSLVFYDAAGELWVDVFLFKSIMVLVSTTVGGWLLLRTLRLRGGGSMTGLYLGAVWMVLNWALDALILLPLSGMTMAGYVMSVGLRYFAMPVQGYLLGAALEGKQ